MGFFIGVIFSIIGMAIFAYGKKMSEGLYLIGGILLMIYPYFVYDVLWTTVIGVAIIGAIIFLRRYTL